MSAAISAERWAAAYALMLGELPTHDRLAAVMGIGPTALAEKARGDWPDCCREAVKAAFEELRDRLIGGDLLSVDGAKDAGLPGKREEV